MKTSIGAASTVYPEPAFIIGTYNDDGTPNAMMAAWGGIANDKKIMVCIDKGHRTAENLLKRRAFTVSMAEADVITACDYLGIVSGHNVPDKVARSGLHAVKSTVVDAPMFEELRMCLECRMTAYGDDEMLIGDIVDIKADPSVLTDGKIDREKMRPVAYDPVSHDYVLMGEKVGDTFSIGKKLK